MKEENEPILIGESEDIDQNCAENFEHEDIDYTIYHLNSGFFATQGHCSCEEQAFFSEGTIEDEDLKFSDVVSSKYISRLMDVFNINITDEYNSNQNYYGILLILLIFSFSRVADFNHA